MRTAASSLRPLLRSYSVRQNHNAAMQNMNASSSGSRHLGVSALASASAVGAAGLLAWASVGGKDERSASNFSSRIQSTATKMEINALGSSVDAINHSLGFILGHLDVHTPYPPRNRKSTA